MRSPTYLTIIASYALIVQARNDTLVHGWQTEPNGRGTWSILWSCLATIFICTWSALHLKVPEKHGQWRLFFHKMRLMLVAAVAPEWILCRAAKNWVEARKVFNRLSAREESKWSMTHLQFAYVDGFCTWTPDGIERRCTLADLVKWIEKGEIEEPPISKKELQSRGKSDWIAKSIALSQIA